MKKLPSILIVCCLAFVGCLPVRPSNNVNIQSHEISDWKHFSIQSIRTFREHILRDDGSVALTTYNTRTVDRDPFDVSIHMYPSISSRCSPSITGALQTENIAGTDGQTGWGRVDVWEEMEGGDLPDWQHVLCTKDGTPPPEEVYVLCSEKDGKTVVICLNEMTDNPSLAEQIFFTFRWNTH